MKKIDEKVIFICTDETFHEVNVKSSFENVTRSKDAFVENYSIFQDIIEFTIMQ